MRLPGEPRHLLKAHDLVVGVRAVPGRRPPKADDVSPAADPQRRLRAERCATIVKGMPTDHLEDLRAEARLARERYQLYKARTFGQQPTSEERLRELRRAYEQAEQRRRFAEAEERRARSAQQDQQDPG